MKKSKLIISICIAATLSSAIIYEFSKIQENNKIEMVESINSERVLQETIKDQEKIIEEKAKADSKTNEVNDKNEEKIIQAPKSEKIEDSKVENNIIPQNEEAINSQIYNNEVVESLDEFEKTPNRHETTVYSDESNYIAEIEQAVFLIVNEERVANGLAPLSYNNTMQSYGRIKSQDMATRGYFDHVDPSGELITAQMQRDGVSYNAWGENIAYIQGDSNNASLANQFMTNWMNSQGHRENILSQNFTSIGVGVYKIGNTYYATQEFYR